MFKTQLTEMLGIEHPIILAGMAGVSQPELAAAVSNAGGLGVLGSTMLTADTLRAQMRRMKDMTDKPWGVDLLLAENAPGLEEAIDVIFEERPPVFVSGLGSPGAAVERMHAEGIKVIALVGNLRHARRCAEDGVDIIVAQGHEAGGHTGRIGALALIPQVVEAVAPRPVVAAGGFVDGRGLVAALALGACGVLMGTRFIATDEAFAHVNYKQALVNATDNATVVTRAYTGKTARALRNAYTDEWERRQDEIKPFPLQFAVAGENLVSAIMDGEMERGCAFAGQCSGLIHEIVPAGRLVRQIVDEAERLLAEMSASYIPAGESTR
jgi:enoyl-[acyl-carrier protein] reductase II